MLELAPLFILFLIFAGLLILILAGLQIGFALVLVGVISLVIFPNQPLLQPAAEVGWSTLNNFTLTAVPLFLFMGQIMSTTGISEQLYKAAHRWLRILPGGLANANIGSSAIFAALSGSSLATAAAIGSIAIPAMESRGYNPRLTYGSLAAGGTLGILIPPSIAMILYGYIGFVSIGKLFMAGIIPGILVAIAFIVYIVIQSWRNPHIAPRDTDRSQMLGRTIGAVPALLLVVAVLGSIYAGIATPTEAAAVGAFGALIIAAAQKRLTFRGVRNGLKETSYITAMVGLVMAGSQIIAFVLHKLRIPIIISETLASSGLNIYLIFALIILLIYILGCLIDSISIILIMTPILVPIMTALNFDLIWFGVIFTIAIEVALITPPVGMNLFVIKGVAPNADIKDIMYGTLPFIIILTIGIVVFTIWPQLVLWLPNAMQN